MYLDLDIDLLPDLDLAGELEADLLPERAGELDAEWLPDFERTGDLETDFDLLWDWERDLEPLTERDLDRLSDLERLREGDRLPDRERLPDGEWLPDCERLSDLDLDRLRETLLDFDLDWRDPEGDLDGLLELRLPDLDRDLELKIIQGLYTNNNQ